MHVGKDKKSSGFESQRKDKRNLLDFLYYLEFVEV